MEFPDKYNCLFKNTYSKDEYSIIPIRYEDRIDIMNWRNEQLYHLRQDKVLTIEDQDRYFNNVVAPLFFQKQPTQLLFSFLKAGVCIGYGGLVHINWKKRSSEVSFIMQTSAEEMFFKNYWTTFLKLLEQVAFLSLKIDKLFTYAYDLRPHLYKVLESQGFLQSSRLKNEITVEGEKVDVLIHEKKSPFSLMVVRSVNYKDMDLLFEWANDPLNRKQSYQSEKISLSEHQKWFEEKLKNDKTRMFIVEMKNKALGLVRFEVLENRAVIGVVVSENFRGKGLGVKVLILACEKYFETFSWPIEAYIKQGNIASIKSFKKVGFVFSEERVINGEPSVVYQLKK